MTDQPVLTIVPIFLKQANEYVSLLHRHHKPLKIHVFSLAVADETNKIRGVAIIARPVSQYNVDGFTLEVARVATDGCPNACSALYGAAWRTAKAMGYTRMFTYTLPDESGASLRGAGWLLDEGLYGGASWNTKTRERQSYLPLCKKLRWHIGSKKSA